MHGNHCRDDTPGRPVNQLSAPLIKVTSVFEVVAEFLRSHGVSLFVDVHEGNACPGLRNRFGRGDKRVGDGDDDVSRGDSRGQESEAQCIGAAVDSNAVFGIAKCRKFALKLVDHRSTDETRGSESFLGNRQQFAFQLLVRRNQIE